MTLNTLDSDAFKLCWLWIHQHGGRSCTLAELMSITRASHYKIRKALIILADNGLAHYSGLAVFDSAELTINAYSLFMPVEDFQPGSTPLSAQLGGTPLRDQQLGSTPLRALENDDSISVSPEVLHEEKSQDSLQKKFFEKNFFAESLRVVVVNDSDLDHDQQQRLGADKKNFFADGDPAGDWPVPEILENTGIEPRRHPAPSLWLRFIAWLIYGYQFKADPDGKGILSPAHFALSRVNLQPAPAYLEIAQAGPVAMLDAMDDFARDRWRDILYPAKKNGLYDLLDPYFPETGDPEDDQ